MTSSPDRNQPAQDAAKDEAGQVADNAQRAASEVTDTAREEARQVTDEATGQIKSLASSAQDEFYSQAGSQQQRLAEQSRTVSDDLQRISRGEPAESDLVNRVVGMMAQRAEQFTTQLENKEPSELLGDVRRFASRRPGLFLAVAAGVGLAAGRLTRGLADNDEVGNSGDSEKTGSQQGTDTAPPVRQTTPSSHARYEETTRGLSPESTLADPTRQARHDVPGTPVSEFTDFDAEERR